MGQCLSATFSHQSIFRVRQVCDLTIGSLDSGKSVAAIFHQLPVLAPSSGLVQPTPEIGYWHHAHVHAFQG